MMSRHRFPCHLLGPDADEPVEEFLARLEDSPNCQVGQLQNFLSKCITCGLSDSLVNG